ncbi:MAG TPA: peroxide stress protein YaaA, partial [Cellvibrionales bacterium]|nr:peroxide stress protein YaaA [Cellvibrionales bacterium]
MLVVISPAKTLDFETPAVTNTATKPLMLKDSTELVELMREYAPEDIVNLMSVSQKIGELNSERFMNWHTPFTKKNAKQAVLAFKGDVYTGLDAESFDDKDFEFAQAHLRILSGLYGVLKPLDLIQAYRLEMGTKLDN